MPDLQTSILTLDAVSISELEQPFHLPKGVESFQIDLTSFEAFFEKDAILRDRFGEPVEPRDFYSELFNQGVDLQSRDGNFDGRANVIVVSQNLKTGRLHRFTIHPDNNFEDLNLIPDNEFAFMSPISYFGKSRTLKNARFMYALTLDLDGVSPQKLTDGLLFQIGEKILPRPTYIANSGTGVHLYYKLEVPIPMYPAMRDRLKELKDALVRQVWNQYTSDDPKIQWQSINQGFRIVGGKTKNLLYAMLEDEEGHSHSYKINDSVGHVTVYRTGNEVTLSYLKDFVFGLEQLRLDEIVKYESKLTLAEAKEKYPEWYEKRIEKGEPPKRWAVNRAVYDYWKKKAYEGATFGHRYWCVYTLAAFARKCGTYDAKRNPNPVTRDELIADAKKMRVYLNKLSAVPFTVSDMKSALKVYDDEELSHRLTKKYLEKETAVPMPPQIPRKEHPQKQEWHLEDARARKAAMKRRGQPLKAPDGRPSKEALVTAYLEEHPEATVKEVSEALGISRKTASKWMANKRQKS